MGYKYGVWLVYNKDEFPTEHIGHFTIACYMEKEEASRLYSELINKYGKYQEIYTECKKPITFEQNMYEDDNNDLYAWGYEGHILENGMMTKLWSKIEETTKKYNCNFSHMVHTSIYYSISKLNLMPYKMDENKIVKCSIELVDITSDDPLNWHIISYDIIS
jgi:hypothetical protein